MDNFVIQHPNLITFSTTNASHHCNLQLTHLSSFTLSTFIIHSLAVRTYLFIFVFIQNFHFVIAVAEKLKMRVAIHFCLLFILLFVITSLTFTSSLTTEWQLPTIYPTIVDFEPCSAFNLTKKDFCFCHLPSGEKKQKENKTKIHEVRANSSILLIQRRLIYE